MEQILKRAKILNILLIVLIIVVSIATHISNIMIYESAAAQDFQIILLQGYRVVSLVLLLLIDKYVFRNCNYTFMFIFIKKVKRTKRRN